MALFQPILSFLRPLGPPRPSTYRHLLRFSTTSRLRIEGMLPKYLIDQESSRSTPPAPPSPNLNASAPPPSESSSLAPPRTPADSRAADLTATEAITEADSAQPSASTSSDEPLSSQQNASTKKSISRGPVPNAKYHVARSSRRNLPIYTDYKRGGNLHITTVRKVSGDLAALRDELREHLKKKMEEVRINDLTKHVIVKVCSLFRVLGTD
jgi:large subunit ribosomal protein L49